MAGLRDYSQEQWRCIDTMTLIKEGVNADRFHGLPKEECWWDIRCDCFWILKNSRTDFWLSLQNI
jgi:hypothetical protein